eukprot:TRINITY_DN3569_c0_g1_i17.p1 TRINITY_DN3569_c0_g1~~TRINITY_DN3569_c0_g1_i17.p1  ORF type:complete len:490 (+),score=153.32 TRINITY_DN3569_c0_g1_i17:48-1517(+)
MLKSLRRETDQRVSKVEQEIRLLNASSRQASTSPAEKGGEASFEYNRILDESLKERMERIKKELRSEFADKGIFLSARKDLDELKSKLKTFEHTDSSHPRADGSTAEKSIEELRREFLAFRASLFEHEKEDSADVSVDVAQRPPDERTEDKKEAEAEEAAEKPGPAVSVPKRSYKSPLGVVETQKALRQLSKRVNELNERLAEIKGSSDNSETMMKELSEKVEALSQSVDKKAAALDMKSVIASTSEINERNKNIKNDVAVIESSLKNLATTEETKTLKGRVSSLESKLTFAIKSMKEFQMKFSELSSFQPIAADVPEDNEDKDEARFNCFADETNKKLEDLKLLVEQQARDFARLSASVSEQLNSKASVENLIELENKIYKELDKVLYTLGKKIASIDCRKEVSAIQVRVKRIYEFYLTSVSHLRGHGDEALLVKRSLEGVSCISCDKDVSNVYEMLNQSHDYITWNRLPQRDPSLLHPKVVFWLILQ